MLLREVDERLGATSALAEQLVERRCADQVTHPLVELLRTRLQLIALGYKDQNDADLLRHDPSLLFSTSTRRGTSPLSAGKSKREARLPSQPTLSRLTDALTRDGNLETLKGGVFDFARRDVLARRVDLSQGVTIDVDSFPVEVYGEQPGSEYNGHYKMRCFHPLVFFLAETQALLAGELRPGNVHTADGTCAQLSTLIDRVQGEIGPVKAVRGDAGFPGPRLLSMLDSRGIDHAFRIKTNKRLAALAKPHLKRPPGRPPSEPRTWFHELEYRASSWDKSRRVVLVVLERPGHLFLEHFFLLASWSPEERSPEEVLEFYRRRGTFESHIGEFKSVVCPALSCTIRPRPGKRRQGRDASDAKRANQATFQLFLLAYNLMNTARRELDGVDQRLATIDDDSRLAQTPKPKARAWSLDRFRQIILRAAARVTLHGRRATFTVCDTVRELWDRIWRRVAGFAPLPGG